MNLKPSEIESIDEIGEMDGYPVRLVKCIGGFFMAIGKNRSGQDEALAGGSHAAIVKYTLEKKYSSFRPAMEKSEFSNNEKVIGMSELVPKEFRNKGYDLHTLKKNEETEYVFSKHGSEIVTFKSFPLDNKLVVCSPNKTVKPDESFVTASLVKAVVREANSLHKDIIAYREKLFKVSELKKI